MFNFKTEAEGIFAANYQSKFSNKYSANSQCRIILYEINSKTKNESKIAKEK